MSEPSKRLFGKDRSGRTRSIHESLRVGENSFNFLRIALALIVLICHAGTVGGYGFDGVINQKSAVDTIAVYGFFSLSGYLIASSADRNSVPRYLWSRFLRVLPGFWVSLVLTAFLFSLVGWFGLPHTSKHPGTLSAYFFLSNGPVQYVINNFYLEIIQLRIGHYVWNGSLWTLYYEFGCYLLLALLCFLKLFRFRFTVVLAAALSWGTLLVITIDPALNREFNVIHNWVTMNFLVFLPIFLVGSMIYLYRELIPDSGLIALASLLVFVASFWMPFGAQVGPFRLSSVGAMAPFLVYPVLWLGIHLPFEKVGSLNDYSYGVYIYAYPVERLLSVWGANSWGFVPYALLAILGTIPFAVGSWFLIERRAMKKKHLSFQWLVPANTEEATPIKNLRLGPGQELR